MRSGLFLLTSGLVLFTLAANFALGLVDHARFLEAAAVAASVWAAGAAFSIWLAKRVTSEFTAATIAKEQDLRRQREQIETNQAELELKLRQRSLDLESDKQKMAQAHDSLLRTTRLSSLGELAGVAAHEILNPLSSVCARVESMERQASEIESGDLKTLGEITSAWKTAYDAGGWGALQQDLMRSTKSGIPLFEEDLANIAAVVEDEKKRRQNRCDDLANLRQELARITEQVDKMRTLSNVGGDRRLVDAHTPLDDAIAALLDLIARQNTFVVKEYSSEPRERFLVVASPDELVQVFSSLIRNSVQAIEQAKRKVGEIRIATSRSNERVEIRITDNGAGISQELRQRVFEPALLPNAKEGGLGLSISRRLMRAFGGDIEIEKTQEGQGTTVLAWLLTQRRGP